MLVKSIWHAPASLCNMSELVSSFLQLLRNSRDFTKKETVIKVQKCLQSAEGDVGKNMQLGYVHTLLTKFQCSCKAIKFSFFTGVPR